MPFPVDCEVYLWPGGLFTITALSVTPHSPPKASSPVGHLDLKAGMIINPPEFRGHMLTDIEIELERIF